MTEPPPAVTPLAPDASAAIDAVVARALAKEPPDRYPSAGDLARAVAAALAGQHAAEPERTVAIGRAAPGAPVSFTPPPPATPTVAEAPAPAPASHVTSVLPQRSTPWLAIVVVLAILAAGGVAIAVILGGRDSAGGTQAAAAGDKQRQQPPKTDPLRAPVEQMSALLDLSAEGRAITARGDFAGAADNRREILTRLASLSVPADLEPSRAQLQRAMQASLAADNAHQTCGSCAAASRLDTRASALKRSFARTFNPFAQHYLQRSFDPGDI
jgi:hypothetical protein